MDRFISDLHFGHKTIIRFDNRPFKTIEENDQTLIERHNAVVKPTDVTYFLGDISWHGSKETKEIFDQMNGKKILIKGNHDRGQYEGIFDEILPYKEIVVSGGKTVVLCHYPIHFFNKHYYGAFMFYGHVHNSHEWNMTESLRQDIENIDVKCNMINVGCMMPYMDYTPKTFTEIVTGYNKWRNRNE